MKNKNVFLKTCVVLSLIFLPACGPNSSEPSPEPSSIPSQTSTPIASATATSSPTETLAPSNTPTETLSPATQITTSATPSGEADALNAQIEELQITLTASAAEIIALQAQNNVLKTQIAVASNNSSSGSGGSSGSDSDIPSNVMIVTTIKKTFLRDKIGENKQGAPVMRIKDPRIILPSGTYTWIYKKTIKADGGTIYHEIYDPDGKVTRVLYIRAQDFQVRSIGSDPFPDDIPLDVVLAEFPDKAFAREIVSYTSGNKPIFLIAEPRVQFDPGDRTWIRAVETIGADEATYYEIYDPDGQVTVRYFVRKQDITISNVIN